MYMHLHMFYILAVSIYVHTTGLLIEITKMAIENFIIHICVVIAAMCSYTVYMHS